MEIYRAIELIKSDTTRDELMKIVKKLRGEEEKYKIIQLKTLCDKSSKLMRLIGWCKFRMKLTIEIQCEKLLLGESNERKKATTTTTSKLIYVNFESNFRSNLIHGPI